LAYNVAEGKRSALLSQEEGKFQSLMLTRFAGGTSARATLSGRAALLTQEGVARSPVQHFICKPIEEHWRDTWVL